RLPESALSLADIGAASDLDRNPVGSCLSHRGQLDFWDPNRPMGSQLEFGILKCGGWYCLHFRGVRPRTTVAGGRRGSLGAANSLCPYWMASCTGNAMDPAYVLGF